MAYLLHGLTLLPSIRPLHMKIEYDGKVIEDAGRLYKAFNDTSVSDEDFIQQLSQADSKELARFSRRIRRLSDKWKTSFFADLLAWFLLFGLLYRDKCYYNIIHNHLSIII